MGAASTVPYGGVKPMVKYGCTYQVDNKHATCQVKYGLEIISAKIYSFLSHLPVYTGGNKYCNTVFSL